MKTVIIDDEPNSVSVLNTLINKYCRDLNVVATFSDSREGLDYLLTHDIDLLFLDIQMPYLTGLEVLQKVPNRKFNVIFVTAYGEYAIDAIKLSALDYLLKPIDPESLIAAVSKFERSISNIVADPRIEKLIKNQKNGEYKVLVVQLQEKTLFLDPKEICYIKSDSNYADIFMSNETKYTTSKTVKYYQEQLDSKLFFRPHQSYLVNISYIQEYSKIDNSVRLKNSKLIPVSKNKKDKLLSYITDFVLGN